MDISTTITPKSDQLNSDDLIAGPRTITITRVTANESAPDQPVNVFFDGDDGKPFRPCKTVRRIMVAVWGSDAASYPGKSMTLYRDPEVTWGGMKVGGIRISHMSGLDRDKQLVITESKTKRKPIVIKPIADAPKPAAQTGLSEEDIAKAVEAAKTVARRGTAAFKEWWNTEDRKAVWPLAKAHADEIKKIAADADEINGPADDDEDPFGLPKVDEETDEPDKTPTPEQLAEAERQSREWQAKRDAEASQ